jgi:hypothetical protein
MGKNPTTSASSRVHMKMWLRSLGGRAAKRYLRSPRFMEGQLVVKNK